MAKEIERKFLVTDDGWREGTYGTKYRQGYIPTKGCVVRIRRAGEKGYLTIKGPNDGAQRDEYEYEIPLKDAEELFRFCSRPLIEKTRREVIHVGKTWVVDEFHGENKGLILAEVELKSVNDSVFLPTWVGKEVTKDFRYANSYLAENPFNTW